MVFVSELLTEKTDKKREVRIQISRTDGVLASGTRCLRGGIRITIPGSRCSVPLQGGGGGIGQGWRECPMGLKAEEEGKEEWKQWEGGKGLGVRKCVCCCVRRSMWGVVGVGLRVV
jgi:hypothetical protein